LHARIPIARRLYEAGMAPVEIRQNLGHAGLPRHAGPDLVAKKIAEKMKAEADEQSIAEE